MTNYLDLPSPIGNGWSTNSKGELVPYYMSNEAAPGNIAELVHCYCQKGSKGRCSCKSVNLQCTQACGCDELCANTGGTLSDDEDD